MTKCVVQTFVSTPSAVNKAIERYYKKATNGPHKEPPDG